MSRWKAALVLGLAISLMGIAAPAQAQQLTVTDPSGDTTARGLDIVGATIHNRDRGIVTDVTFTKDRRGNFIEVFRARHGHFFALAIEHRRTGPDTIHLLSKQRGELPCAHMSSTWQRSAGRVRLRVPAKCLDGGNYGAIHAWLLSEKRDGTDVDMAPTKSNGAIRFTTWIPRG